MIRNSSLGQRLGATFGGLALLALVLGINSLYQTTRLYGSAQEIADVNMRVVQLAEQVRFGVEQMRSTVRLSFIDGIRNDVAGVGTREKAVAGQARALEGTIKTLRELTDAGTAKTRCDQLLKMAADYQGLVAPIFRALEAGNGNAAADAAKPATAASNQMQELVAEILSGETTSLQEDQASLAATYRWGQLVVWGTLLAALAVCAVTAVFIRRTTKSLRSTAGELRASAEQVAAAAVQVASASQELSRGATEQAASLEESSAAMEEMGATTRENAARAGEAASLMSSVDRQVADSQAVLGEVVDSMTAIAASSAKVAKIIKTIDEIAFQTNILALNAAVEAARAGEAGMGFAVVADEVRGLAQRAAQAARDTSVLLEESSATAQQGEAKVGRMSAAIEAFTSSVGRVKEIAEQVSTASRQQAQGISEVSSAIQQMEKVTQTTAATAEESAAASEELSAQSEVALDVVRGLDQMVGGSAVQPSAVVPPVKARAATPPRKAPLRVLSREHRPETVRSEGSYGAF